MHNQCLSILYIFNYVLILLLNTSCSQPFKNTKYPNSRTERSIIDVNNEMKHLGVAALSSLVGAAFYGMERVNGGGQTTAFRTGASATLFCASAMTPKNNTKQIDRHLFCDILLPRVRNKQQVQRSVFEAENFNSEVLAFASSLTELVAKGEVTTPDKLEAVVADVYEILYLRKRWLCLLKDTSNRQQYFEAYQDRINVLEGLAHQLEGTIRLMRST